jgi:hypothetical protein
MRIPIESTNINADPDPKLVLRVSLMLIYKTSVQLSDESMEVFVSELKKISAADAEGEAGVYFTAALTLKDTILNLRYRYSLISYRTCVIYMREGTYQCQGMFRIHIHIEPGSGSSLLGEYDSRFLLTKF